MSGSVAAELMIKEQISMILGGKNPNLIKKVKVIKYTRICN